MLKETEEIVRVPLDFLPLKTYTNITEGNALRLDWESVVPKSKLSYIMGNPPFIGYSLQSKSKSLTFSPFMLMKRASPIRLLERLIMYQVGILKRLSICREQPFAPLWFQPIQSHKGNRWQVFGNHCLIALGFISTLPIGHSVGIARPV